MVEPIRTPVLPVPAVREKSIAISRKLAVADNILFELGGAAFVAHESQETYGEAPE